MIAIEDTIFSMIIIEDTIFFSNANPVKVT